MPTPVLTPLRAAVVIAALAGGCVIPVGPQFDNPEDNYPPYVVTSMPPVGDIFTPGDREIVVTLSDQNLNDNLFIRFLIDYPGNPAARLLLPTQLPPTGELERGTVRVQPRCDDVGVGSGQHRLMMAVADRPFLNTFAGDDVDPEAPLDSVPEGAKRIRVFWILFCPGAAQ
jgi:hypothetical protein